MPFRFLLMALSMVVGVASASAQDGAKALKDALVKHQMYLRGFSGENEVRFKWDGTQLVQAEPRFRMITTVVPKSMKVHGNIVEIRGDEQMLLRQKDGSIAVAGLKTPVKVTVDLAGGDVQSLLPKVVEMVFYEDLKTALAALPKSLRGFPAYADANAKHTDLDPKVHPHTCDCGSPSVSACGTEKPEITMKGATPPSVLSQVEPEFSEEARDEKFSGNVQVFLTVDAAGKPSNLWVYRGVGHGLDRSAVNAVSQYRFRPATCHGTPIPVDLYIDVNFQIF